MKNFIKENIVLVLGISLPILLTLLFILAGTLPKYFISDPEYDLIFSDTNYSKYSFKVINQKLYLQVDGSNRYGNNSSPRIFRYISKTGKTEEISYVIPQEAKEFVYESPPNFNNTNINIPVDPTNLPTKEQAKETAKLVAEINKNTNVNKQQVEVLITELEKLNLDTSIEAPDGYIFSNRSDGYRVGLFSEFTGGRRYRDSGAIISKTGKVLSISYNKQNNYSYEIPKFIGWVIP